MGIGSLGLSFPGNVREKIKEVLQFIFCRSAEWHKVNVFVFVSLRHSAEGFCICLGQPLANVTLSFLWS